MKKTPVTPHDAIALLNEASKLDPATIRNLISYRVLCRCDLADHPTIEVDTTESGEPILGTLGIINGLFGVDENAHGPVIAHIPDDSAEPVTFSLNPRFEY